MATNEQSVTLLLRNKAAIVAGLRDNGFAVDDNLRMSDVPRLIRMGAGLLDLTVACVRKPEGEADIRGGTDPRAGEELYLTVGEWQNLTEEQRGRLARRGLRVRGHGECFIIAADSFAGRTWGEAFAAASAYKAYTAASSGIEDTAQWNLPTLRQAQTMHMHRDAINDALSAVWSAEMELKGIYWTSEARSGNVSLMVDMECGAYMGYDIATACYGRPVCRQALN